MISSLMQRVFTSVVLIPITVALIFFAPLPLFSVAVLMVILAAAWEWTNLMGLRKRNYRIGYVVLMACLAGLTLMLPPKAIFGVALVWWGLAWFWLMQYPNGKEIWTRPFLSGFFGTQVLLPLWVGMIGLRQLSHGEYWVLWFVLLIWAADIGAYFVGKRFGKKRLMPQISPGKTWNGVWGGITLSLLVGIAGLYVLQIDLLTWGMWLLSIVAVIGVSILGDLVLSMFKRQRGIKDSGILFPGHGGVLDRIDSLASAMPVFGLVVFLTLAN